ncbi:MAG TPA: DUF1572 family protein [Bryobacteraceae bacterium]|jgi:uncharacterized damage-inducible protein DinB
MTIEETFVTVSARRMGELMDRLERAVAKLTPEQVWMRASENENAVGNLVLHLTGNVRQWILSGLGGAEDRRVRDAEFEARGGEDVRELMVRLRAVVQEAQRVIGGMKAEELMGRVVIQKTDVTKMEAVMHVLEHFSGHAFQVFFAAKMFTSGDLGFYAHLRSK